MMWATILICACIILGGALHPYHKEEAWLLWCFAGAMTAGMLVANG